MPNMEVFEIFIVDSKGTLMAKRHNPQKSARSAPVTNTSKTNQELNATVTPFLEMAVLVLSGVGILLTLYLTYTALFEDHPAFCGEGSGCDVVQSSRWSTLLGMPMAFWGLLTYIGVAWLAWRGRRKPSSWTVSLFVSIGGFAISAYLTVVSVVEIEATCPYCLASFATITAIMILTLVRKPPDWSTSSKEAVVIALLIVGGLHMHYSGWFDASAGPEDPQLQALAIHLTQTGAKFYGAYWCPRCQEQKTVFEASAKRLPYVECSSGGRGSALTAPCVKKKIRSYPTWIIGEQRLTGLQTPRALAGASGFKWSE